MVHVLVLVAHPDLRVSRVNAALLQAAREAAAEADSATQADERSHCIEVRDLYALYPDYVIDVPLEQRHAARADLIVWQHPIHWYGMPPLMKLWLDDVLTLGWAYGSAAAADSGAALRGKSLWAVLSTGGPAAAYRPDGYNRYAFDAFLPPYEQTAVLCGLRFLPPLLLHGAHGLDAATLAGHVAAYRERLLRYPAWPERDALGDCPDCPVPTADRPADAHGAEAPR